MSVTVDAGPDASAAAAVEAFGAALSGLLELDLTSVSDDALVDVLRDVETQRRRLEAVDQALIAAARDRGLAGALGQRDLPSLLRALWRVAPREAHARVRAAAACAPQLTLTGEVVPPIYPDVAAAQAAGDISAAHARAIVKAVEDLPDAVRAVEDRAVEQTLVAAARDHDPATLARLAHRIAAHLDPDGRLVEAAERHRRRGITLHQRPDGSAHGCFELDALTTERLLTTCDALARPRPDTDEHGVVHPDPRTPAQRRHDALSEALGVALRTGQLPLTNGVTATVVLTMSAADYERRQGLAVTGHGALVPVPEALDWIDDATQLIGVLFRGLDDPDGPGIAAISSTLRLFTAGQRRAIHARDHGCTFPGCDTPPAWTQIHHITEHQRHGPTHTDNGAAVCGYHHRHHTRLGWRCIMHHGHPAWIPPIWIDPEQKPRRNRLHPPVPEPP